MKKSSFVLDECSHFAKFIIIIIIIIIIVIDIIIIVNSLFIVDQIVNYW